MPITEICSNSSGYGEIRYFLSDRCFCTEGLRAFNRNMISAEEIVTFDCGLMDMEELAENAENTVPQENQQVLAVIIRPAIHHSYLLRRGGRYDFCGYDLVEGLTCTSALTNCGAGFEKAIPYGQLNRYGLFGTYRETVYSQLELDGKYPDESHAYCEIVEIWRRTH